MSWPDNHSIVKIESLKHDGSLNRRWEENTILFVDSYQIIGMNHRTLMTDYLGRQSYTIQPALFYFDRQSWFNIVYIFAGSAGFYYCNISSPCSYENGIMQYIDYDIDIVVQQDLSYRVIDVDEYVLNCKTYHYSKEIQHQIIDAVHQLEEMIVQENIPFQKPFIEKWQQAFRNR